MKDFREQLIKDQQAVIRFHEITAWAHKRYCSAVAERISASAFHKYMINL